uniref:Uncharacterized protein n=1 Tax=Anguilla anguilla TaxID=7936 RepID=A0A0E9WJP9_ANGAN
MLFIYFINGMLSGPPTLSSAFHRHLGRMMVTLGLCVDGLISMVELDPIFLQIHSQ